MYIRKYAASTATGRDAHFDGPLSNLAIKAFQGRDGFIAQQLMPIVPVGKQSDKYYIIDKDSWLLIPDTRRAPKTSPKRVEFKVSSESYFCDNYALAGENAKEDLANADMAIQLRKNAVDVVMDALLRDYEVRVANAVTSLTNLGSGVSLTGTAKWSDYSNSDPIADVTTGHATIRQNTGLTANTLVIDEDTLAILIRHSLLLDMYKYTSGGQLKMDQLKDAFRVDNILVGRGVKNNAREGATASITNIWGNNAILARVSPGVGLQTETFGLSFRWTPANMPAPMQVRKYDDADPGKAVEVVDVGYYQDEKVVASALAYGISGTL